MSLQQRRGRLSHAQFDTEELLKHRNRARRAWRSHARPGIVHVSTVLFASP